MRSVHFKSALLPSALAASVLLLGNGAAWAQSVDLTAAAANANLPDGSSVPMWGYTCTASSGTGVSCARLSPNAGWSPVVITVPSGTATFTINLTNSLPAGVPTSLTIVGQLGGGLGTPGNTTQSPDHTNAQTVTWPIADPGTLGAPPGQGSRVQSFGAEVASGGAPVPLCWGTACSTPTPALKPGTYLIESGTHPSIQGPMGLYGILVVTAAPNGAAGTAYPGVAYNSEIPLLLSEIDPVQNAAVASAAGTAGFVESNVWSGFTGANNLTVLCKKTDGTAAPTGACYPPAVNYTPLYYLVNGVAFSKPNAAASLFAASALTPAGATGSVLVRLVNAGLRMHVPSIVGAQTGAGGASGFSLIAEDGNVLPGVPRVQSEVFMAAGKTYDVMINVPAATASALPIFDREGSLSINSIGRDGGMLAYIGVNGSALPVTGAFAAAATQASANDDIYNALAANQPFVVSDPALGVIRNDVNVYAVTLLAQAGSGTVNLNKDGTFSYTPSGSGTTDSFTYCANGTVTAAVCSSGLMATVHLNPSAIVGDAITCTLANPSFPASNVATSLAVKPPGVLGGCKDNAGLPMTVVGATAAAPVSIPLSPSGTVLVDANGGFTASVPAGGTYTFSFQAQNSQATATSASTLVTLQFAAANGPVITVKDGATKAVLTGGLNNAGDYRWVIEEDQTFFVDPNCTTNPLPPACPRLNALTAVPFNFGTNFHTSHMPLVAAGCTGPVSCEGGQSTGQGADLVVCDIGNGVCRHDASGNGFTPTSPSSVHLDPSKRYYISILPGDAAQPFIAGYAGPPDCSPAGVAAGSCGHGMGGAPIAAPCALNVTGCTSPFAAVTVLTVPTPNP